MSDLISRSELYMNDLIRRKDVLALFPTNDCSDKMVGLYERVLDIPTAYDVDKVVAELEEQENIAILKAPNTSDIYNPNYQKWMMKSYGFKEAIDIVKRGGIDGENVRNL